METEFYGDGQHNGGVYNSGNLNPYIYCYQNPIKYIDQNGKQVWFMTPPSERISTEQANMIIDLTPGVGDVKGLAEGLAGYNVLEIWEFAGSVNTKELQISKYENTYTREMFSELKNIIKKLDDKVFNSINKR